MRSRQPRWLTGCSARASTSERSHSPSYREARPESEPRCRPRTLAMILIRQLRHLRRCAGSSRRHGRYWSWLLANNLLAERYQGDLDQLEVRDRQGDTDDRDAQQDSGGDMRQRKPPAGDDHPDDIANEREDPRVWLVDQLAAERPGGIVRHPERGNTPGNRDDQHAADDSCQHVRQPEPEAAEDEPDDVEQSTHVIQVGTGRLMRQ